MIPTYILALLFVLMATWIFYQTSEDVYMVLAAGITIVCFVIGYAHAHWVAQVSIALSLFVLFGYGLPLEFVLPEQWRQNDRLGKVNANLILSILNTYQQ